MKMPSRIHNVIVVGSGNLSTAILHAFSHASSPIDFSEAHHIHQSSTSTLTHTHDHHDVHTSPYTLALLTRPQQEPSAIHSVQHRTSDYTLESLSAAFKEQDVVISTIAPADIPSQKRLIDAALAGGVRHFIPCEFSYDTQNPDVRDAYPPCAARAEVLDYLREKCGQNTGFNWTALATGCNLENGLLEGLLAFDLQWKSATVYGAGDVKFPCSTLDGVGRAVIQALRGLEEGTSRNSYFYKAEFVTSQNELLEALERADGKKWDMVSSEVDECVREGERRMEKGFFDGAMMLLERNVLFGGVGDRAVWGMDGDSGEGEGKLEKVVKGVVERLERDGKADCGCG